MSRWLPHSALAAPPAEPILLWNQGGRSLYIEEKWGPAVPYPALKHHDGTRNNGYRRIKGDKDAISKIPEAEGWPEMLQFLEAINSQQSPFESIGCEKTYSPIEGGGDAKIRLGSYVDVVFSNTVRNDEPKNLISTAATLFESLQSCESWWATVEFGLQRLRHLPGATTPWGLMLRISNDGRSAEEARQFWGVTLQRLGNAILNCR